MKKYGVNELRKMFLDFFESKGHLAMKSFSLVPHNDNSLLLINSGMAPLKPYFTGQEIPPRTRVCTCQKCIRTGDIENIGKTARHGTFFEMLGNFSFGDYFKEEAIHWSWEFLTELWSADNEEFLYIVDIPHLTLELYEKWRDYIQEDGMQRVKPGPGHMASYITPVFICDTCDEDARKALKKCRIYKSFHFSLHGWMDYHNVVAVFDDSIIDSNFSGKSSAKFMKKIFYHKKTDIAQYKYTCNICSYRMVIVHSVLSNTE